jgi:hypothetical protein
VGEGKRAPQLQLLLAPQLRYVPVQHRRAPNPDQATPSSSVQYIPLSLSYTQEDDNNPHSPGPTTLNTYPIGPCTALFTSRRENTPLFPIPCQAQVAVDELERLALLLLPLLAALPHLPRL